MTEYVGMTQRFPFIKRLVLCILLLGMSLSVCACGYRAKDPVAAYLEDQRVADLKLISQNPANHLPLQADLPQMTCAEQAVQFAAFKEFHFAPWQQTETSHSKEDAFWGTTAFPHTKGYAENLLPWSREAMAQLVARQNMDAYPNMARHAITVRNSSLRVLPTVKPYFLSPVLPGEGFPFDYFQNSSVHVGTPLFVSHKSVSGKWLHVETAYATGWIPASDVAYVTEEQKALFMSGTLYALMHDDLALKTMSGEYLSTGFVGAVFPLSATPVPAGALKKCDSEHAETQQPACAECMQQCVSSCVGQLDVSNVQLWVPARTITGAAEFFSVPLAYADVAQMPVTFTPRALANLAKDIVGQRYGWGGLFLNRDCSSSVRDLFTPFGVWLPRNSGAQAAKGEEAVPLEGLTAEEKQEIIITKGIPFFSLIGMKGHIGIYLGYEPKTKMPLMLHDIWGVRTVDGDTVGRAIIGRLSITTLRPGEERRDVEKGDFYSKVLKLQIKPGTWALE